MFWKLNKFSVKKICFPEKLSKETCFTGIMSRKNKIKLDCQKV